MAWIRALRFEHAAQQVTLVDYLGEVDHATQRIERLERAIDDAVAEAPLELRAVIDGLQALRGVAKVMAVTLAVEVGSFSRFDRPTKLMTYCGVVPSEHSSGASRRQGAITKSGNAHVRRVLAEAAWCYRHRPGLWRSTQGATERPTAGGHRDSVEGAAPAPSPLRGAARAGQAEPEGRDRASARAPRLRLGHRCVRRATAAALQHPAAGRRVGIECGTSRNPPRRRTKENPRRSYRWLRPARRSTSLVRGSSRRIMTMAAGLDRSPTISLINRRRSLSTASWSSRSFSEPLPPPDDDSTGHFISGAARRRPDLPLASSAAQGLAARILVVGWRWHRSRAREGHRVLVRRRGGRCGCRRSRR